MAIGSYRRRIKPPLGSTSNHRSIGDFRGVYLLNEQAGNVRDISGNLQDGTNTGAVKWTSSLMGPVLNFTATDGSYIDCGNETPMQFTGAFTLIADVLLKAVPASPFGAFWVEKYQQATFAGWSLGVYHDQNFIIGVRKDATNYWSLKAPTITLDRWYRVAFVYYGDGTTPTFYLNGVQQAITLWLTAGDALSGFTDSGNSLYFGRGDLFQTGTTAGGPAGTGYVNGLLGRVYICADALPASYIARDFLDPYADIPVASSPLSRAIQEQAGGALGGGFPIRRTYRPRPFAPGIAR